MDINKLLNIRSTTLPKVVRKRMSILAKKHLGIAQDSKFFQTPSKKVAIIATTNKFDFSNFNSFVIAFSRLYRLNITSAGIVHSLILIINLYIALYLLHDSRIVTRIVNRVQHLYIPEFLHPVLMKIASRVLSKNKSGSWTNGDVYPETSAQSVFLELRLQTQHDWERLLARTPFFSVIHNQRLREQFFSELELWFETSFGCDEVDVFLRNLESLPEAVYDKITPLAMYEGRITSDTSISLGIYRFRDFEDDCYLVNSASCAALSLQSLDFMACFLKLYKPTFSYEGGSSLPKDYLPGDSRFVMSELSCVDAWEFYLSNRITDPIHKKEIADKQVNLTTAVPMSNIVADDTLGNDIDGLIEPLYGGMVHITGNYDRVYYFSTVRIKAYKFESILEDNMAA